MTNVSKTTAMILGLVAASVLAPSIANAACWTYKSTKYRFSEHKARQAAILGANMKFNAKKGAAVPQHANATNLNAWIAANRVIHPMQLNCTKPGAKYKCKAVKKMCSK